MFDGYICGVTGLPCCGCSLFCQHRKEKQKDLDCERRLYYMNALSKEVTQAVEENYIFGVEPDAPVVENENGGKQSDTPYGFHLLPISALFDAAQVAKYGADKYGETFTSRNYTKIPTVDHLNHALQHIYAFLAGDKQDDHLGHAIVRLMFAFDVNEKGVTKG